MSSFIKSFTSKKSQSTFYSSVQTPLCSLMSGLIVAALTLSLVTQISVSAITQQIVEDPVVIAQQYLDNSQISIAFTKLKSIDEVINYLKTKNIEASNVVAYSPVAVGDQFIDIPFAIDVSKDMKTNSMYFEEAKSNLLTTIKRSKLDTITAQTPTKIFLGDAVLDVKQAQSIENQQLDEASKLQINTQIDRVSFTTRNNNLEIKKLEKSHKRNQIDNKLAINKAKKQESVPNLQTINESDIESINVKNPTEPEKTKIIQEAKTSKEGIVRKANEKSLGPKIKAEKEETLKREKELIKTKKSKLAQKLTAGRQNEITLSEVETIGEEAKELGIEIIKPTTEKERPAITVDLVKFKSYKEPKSVSWLYNVLNLGSLKVDAFYPEQNYVSLYHASANEHFGVSLALQNGNTSNGATIRNEYSYSTWTQKFYMYNDDTIRIAGKCLDMSDYGKIQRGENANNVKVHLWDCNGGNNQKWIYDTEGMLRMKYNKEYCLDTAWSGNFGSPTSVWKCTPGITELWRGGEYEMRIYSTRFTSQYPSLQNVGHTFVGLAKYNGSNYIDCYTTYSLWPYPNVYDNKTNLGCSDKASQGWWDNVTVNYDVEWNKGFNMTANNNYVMGNEIFSYWQKNLNQVDYLNMVATGYRPPNAWYSILGPNWNTCTSYSSWLWNKYSKNNNVYLSAFEPNSLYYYLIATKFYE
jgi:Ricin-type beta-trefoil lectin domain